MSIFEISDFKGKLSALQENVSPGSLVFPGDLASMGHWVAFHISREYVFGSKELPQYQRAKTIYLPMPAQLSTGYQAQYDTESLGVAGQIGAEAGAGGALAGNQGAFNSIRENLTGSGGRGALASAALTAGTSTIGTLVATALGGIGGGIVAAGAEKAITGALAGGGIAQNPHMATVFKGTGFREHNFQYKLIAKNQAESNNIREIIRTFKYHMHPEYIAGNHFFKYPELFDIDFKYPHYLFNIGASVLKGFTVDYHGEGGPYYFNTASDKAPYSVTINLSFQETTITTKEEINSLNR